MKSPGIWNTEWQEIKMAKKNIMFVTNEEGKITTHINQIGRVSKVWDTSKATPENFESFYQELQEAHYLGFEIKYPYSRNKRE